MKTIAYKWRLSTIKYAYITSSEYRKNGSEPNYNLAFISSNCPSAEEDKIKENVRMMSSDEYRKCFEDMLTKISKDEDGQYIKLKNWEYYYHFITNESGDNKILYVNATASAKISEDENVYANVVNNNGVLEFVFDLPRGKDGKDGKDGVDGLPGEPVNDGKFSEAIYILTKNDTYRDFFPDTWIYDDKYQNNDFVPSNWTDRPSGITNEYKYEWVSTRKYYKNDATNEWEWGKFSTPALMSKWGEDGKDGDGIEYIYKRTKEEQAPKPPLLPSDWESPDSEYQKNSEYVIFLADEGWTDSPVGLEKDVYKFEWVSSRKQINNVWQPFSTPALWSTWGKDGDDVEYIFFLNNDNETPEFDDYDINDPEYQDKEYYPTSNGEKWSDDYVSTTYEKRFSWISNRRKSNGKWGEFSKPVLFNTYKIGGKSFIDLYTRYDSALASNDLPEYGSPIYYSFQEDKYYSDSGRTEEITTINSISKLIKWHTDIPVDNTAKMLFKATALVEIKDNLDELIAVPSNSWYGPYLVAANGENAEKMAPYVTLDDDSLSLPIKEDDNTPHESYKYSFNVNLYYGDNKLSITSFDVKASNESKIDINKKELSSDNEELKIEFTIDNTQQFTNIELIYIILYGEYEGKEIKASGQFKIIPFYSKDAVLYKILLNQDAIFVPSDSCVDDNGEGIWSTTLTAKVVNSKGEDISIDNTNNKLVYESKNGELISIPEGGLTLVGCTETTGKQIAIPNLPNPLKIIYQVNGNTREIEYVNFVNMPLNGIDGISSRLVFAYCSLEEGMIPDTPKGGKVNFNTNEIDEYPQGALLDSNKDIIEGSNIEWGDNNNLTGVVWLSQCEYFNDGTNDLTWTTPVRLTGFRGLDSVHIELTNDMDQVYVTDGNVIITGQTIETIVSLLNGGDKMRLSSENVIVNNKYFSCNVENINENDVKVTCILTAGTIDDAVKSIDINIEITGFSTFNYFKTFKALVLNGTIDFDLDVSPTFIKRNKNEQYSNTQIDVNVTKRDLSTTSKTLTVLPYSEWGDNGISVEYYFNNDTDVLNILSGNSNSIYLPDANSDYNIDYDIDKLTIILKRNNTPIDKVYVECVHDGKDGSSYHLELTNEMDQVYVTDNIVKIDQSPITSEIKLFNGINETNGDIKDIGFKNAHEDICDAKISGVIVDDKITHFDLSIDFKTGVAIDSNVINFEITGITKNDVNIVRTFKVVKLNGTKDYDLLVTPTYVKSDKDGNISASEISIKVTESDISTENRQITELSTLHDELDIEIKKNGSSDVDVTYNKGIIFKDFDNFEYLEIYLRRNNFVVDYVKVEKISDGKDGVDGISYNMVLSNDYDQVYVTDDKVVVSQTLNTVVYLLNGLEKIDPNEFTVKVNGNAQGVKTDDNGKKLSFEFTEGSTITGKNINYEITIDYGGKTLKKTFKVVKLNGTKDYDLVINPSIIKKDKHGKYTPNEVDINVSESNISTTNRESKNLVKLPDNWEIRIYNGTLEQYESYKNYNLPFKKYSSGITGYLNVELWSGDTRYDYANIEVVSDGTDGSAYHLELTNEFDQVYTVNKKIIPNQSTTTKVLLFNGTQPVDDFTLTLPKGDNYVSFEEDNSKNIIITFKGDADIEEKELKHVITATTTDGVNIEKTFKAIVLNGNKDYDLKTSHTYIKKKGDNFTAQEVAITVTESTIGTTDRSITTLTRLPEDLLKLKVYKDSVEIEDVNYGENGFIFNPNDHIDLDNSIEVKLYRVFNVNEEPILVDYLKIEVLRDGIDGTSPYHIEFSNDMDQVFTTKNKVVYEQSITTDLSLYLGSKIDDTLTFDDVICECNESWTVTDVSNTGGTLTYKISPNIDSVLTEKEYDFTFYIEKYGISKKFKVIKLDGTLDYDLYSNHTIIKKHTNGYSTSAITIEVKESDISATDKKITTVSTLSGENGLSLKIFVDDVDKTEEITYNSGVTLSLEYYKPTNKILVELYRDDVLIDFIDIEVVSDGKDGEPGADGTNIEFIYILCDDESDLNSNIIPNFSGLVTEDKAVILEDKKPENWGDKPWWTDHPCGITKEKQMEACSQRIKEYGSETWGEWCTPFPWAKWGDDGIDGDGVEYMFYMSDRKNVPGNPGAEIKNRLSKYDGNLKLALTEIVNTFDFFPGEKWITGNTELIETIRTNYNLNEKDFSDAVNSLDFNWTDDPSDVGPFEPVEWVSIRRKKVNPDGTFTYQYTEPTIWAEWKRDTYDSITEFIFTVDSRDLSGCIISGGTWKDLKDKTSSAITFVDTSNFDDVTWYDSVPKHDSINQYVWMVKGYASGEIVYTGGTIEANGEEIPTGITYSQINWTSPTKMIDSQFMQVEYSCIEGNGEIPNPINLSNIISGHNLTLEEIENEFRKADKDNGRTDWNWKDSNELSGETPVWMITSTFYNGEWSNWTVSRIKGEQGPKGETGQGVSIKGSFKNEDELIYAYYYYMQDKNDASEELKQEINSYKNANADKVENNGKLKLPSKYFLNGELILGDSYIVDECTINGETVNGYLFVYVFANDTYTESWEPVGQVKGDSSYIYIVYASSVTINDNSSKTYHLTEGGTYSDGETKYYGTTPGKYIGIHAATQQYEGHPYPEELYGVSARTNDSKFIWSKWEGDDGFGQEQIFILSGKTAPNVPKFENYSANTTIDEWNSPDFTPGEWSDNPLTPTIDKRYCWMATRQFPFNDEGANDFKGVSGITGGTAILFTYLPIDGYNGSSPFHLELSNEMEQVYTINNTIITPQTASTIITLFEGTSGISLNNTNVVLPRGVGATGNSDGSLTIYKVYQTGDTFNNDEELIEIKISGKTIQDLDYDIVRTFKLIKLNGTKDYDLNVTPTYIKKDKNGNLSHSSITISINESEISSTNREIKQTIGVPSGYTLSLSIDDGKYTGLKYGGTSTRIPITGVNNYCNIKLIKDSKTVDSVTVEILKDGINGINGSSPYHVELSNEFDLISTINGKVNGTHIYRTNVQLYEGDVPCTISSITIENTDKWEFTSGITDSINQVKCIFTGETSFTGKINPVIKVNGTHNGYVTIKPMEGVALYQLESDTGFVTKGKEKDIYITVKQKTNDGLIGVDSLPSGMGIYVYYDNATTSITSATTTALTYTYTGRSDISEIDFRLKRDDVIYDNINVEVKNDIKAFGSLNLNPLEKIVYVDDKNKPMVSSLTFDASFIYEGQQVDLTSTALTITVTGNSLNTNDFNTGVTKTTASSLTIDYASDRTIDNLTKEKYIFISEYHGDTYENEFYVTYIKRNFEIMSDGDTIYVPKETDITISRKLGLNVVYNGSNITKECELSSSGKTSDVIFNQRAGVWYANIPKEICNNTGITDLDVVIKYYGLTETKKYTLIRGEENNDYWFINVSPKYLSTGSTPIEIYLTKNSYEGDYYISLKEASGQNVNLYYKIDDGEEINYTSGMTNAPTLHGNNVFYPDGYETGTTVNKEYTKLYSQEPIYMSIEFKLYDENNGEKELLASEVVERFDILRNSEIKNINARGLTINATDIFKDFNENDYEIVIKPVK